jgi:sugar-specific transcriptional regulator TrmB
MRYNMATIEIKTLLEMKLEEVEEKLDKLEKEFDILGKKLNSMENQNYYWMGRLEGYGLAFDVILRETK